MSASSSKDSILLKEANKRIADLKKDIRRLSDELQEKESLLSDFMTRLPQVSSFVVAEHSKKFASSTAALQDTAVWDPSACSRPSRPSCSTPTHGLSWTEVVVHGHKRVPDGSASPSSLSLSNRYAVLVDDELVHPTEAPTPSALRAQDRSTANPATPCLSATGSDDDPRRIENPMVQQTKRPLSRISTSSARRRILKEAVLRRSGGLPRPDPTGNTPSAAAPGSPSSPSPARSHSVDYAPASRESLHLPPLPLFQPTTLILGDSIVRNIRFFNAITHCFPGATVSDIMDKLPVLLQSVPSSINRVIVHVGCNDTARRQSELTKNCFSDLFRLLKQCGKSVFISGPLPTISHGTEHFSRLLSLNTWLQSTCCTHNLGFIDNFNLFWNRPSVYRSDGVHPNRLGSSILAANLQHAVQTAPRH